MVFGSAIMIFTLQSAPAVLHIMWWVGRRGRFYLSSSPGPVLLHSAVKLFPGGGGGRALGEGEADSGNRWWKNLGFRNHWWKTSGAKPLMQKQGPSKRLMQKQGPSNDDAKHNRKTFITGTSNQLTKLIPSFRSADPKYFLMRPGVLLVLPPSESR